MDFFKKEEYIYINNIKISNNGFKNLTFETSKFSNSVTAIRGFGSSLDEKNLNTIDTINVEFIINADELYNIALVYSMFKALGALPLKNKYIIDKIKSSLYIEQSIVDFKNQKLKKDIDYLIVFLEYLKISSIEKTTNGYSVFMKLSLHKNGFTNEEMQTFTNSFNKWDNDVNFIGICKNEINNQISKIKTNQNLELNIYNVEKLNAILKEKLLLSSGEINSTQKEIDKKNYYYENLKKYEDLDNNYILKINDKHIVQIEMITSNIISYAPIQGQTIGMKSFIATDKSYYNVKLIFDENDNELISEIKQLSDKNISNHKIKITHPLINMFDFHSASIKSIIFNNIESMNGVMVTIQFQINSYNVFSLENLNPNNITKVSGESIECNFSNVGFYLEYCIKQMMNKKFNDSSQIISMLSTVIESEYEYSDIYDGNIFISKFGDYISMYSSFITCYSLPKSLIKDKSFGFVDYEYHYNEKKLNLFEVLNYRFNYNSLKSSIIFKNYLENKNSDFFSREFNIDHISEFYNYIDLVTIYSFIANDEILNNLNSEFYSTKNLTDLHKEFFNHLFNYSFSITISNKDRINTIIELIYLKEFYVRFYSNFNFGSLKNIKDNIKTEDYYFNINNINYEKIYNSIKENIDVFYKNFMATFNDQLFHNRIKDEIKLLFFGQIEEPIENENLLQVQVEEYSEELYYEYKNLFDVNSGIICEFSYHIFLSRFLFLLCSCFGTAKGIDLNKNINNYNEIIKPLIVSSALYGFFTLKSNARVDNFGNIYKSTTNKLSEYLSCFYNYANESIVKEDTITLLEEMKKYVKKSYFSEKLNFKKKNLKYDYSITNKDYNYFYGQKIENLFPEKLIYESFLNSYYEESKEKCSEFLLNFRKKFIDDDKNNYLVKWENLNIDLDKMTRIMFYPTFNNIMKNDNNNISEIMKKRIIGNRDPFMDFEKISNIINSDSSETIPDYIVTIKTKEYDNDNSGIYKIINLTKIISMNNLINLSISKNSTTKIKTAIVNFIDFNKEIIEYYGDSCIGILNSYGENIELLKIEPGNEIEIYLGYSDNKKIAYKGFVNKISFSGNILSIECVDVCSSLYSYKLNNINFNDTSILPTKKDLSKVARLILSKGTKVKSIKAYNEMSGYINNHLFNYDCGYDSDTNLKPLFSFGRLYEDASYYNIFGTVFWKTPYHITKFFKKNSYYNRENLLIASMKSKLMLNSMFSDTFSDVSSSSTLDIDYDMLSNVNNIDRDFEVYGIGNNKTFMLNGKYDVSIIDENSSNYSYISEGNNINIIQKPLFQLSEEINMPSESNLITSIFGEYRASGTHKGIDISNNKGDKLFSPMDCRVLNNGYSESYGYYIELYNDQEKLKFKYAHLKDKSSFKINDLVTKGQEIGIMGNTGKSSGTHLHFEVFKNGERIDPLFLFKFKNFIYDWNLIGQTAIKSGGTHALDIEEYKKMVLENLK